MTRQLIARWSWLRAAGAGLAVMAGLLIAHVDGAQPRFFSDDPLQREPETQDASGATPWDSQPVLRPRLQPVRHPAQDTRGSSRAEHQHHRRGAGLELVHQPHRRPSADQRRTDQGPQQRQAARSLVVDRDPREDLGVRRGLHREGRRRRDLVRVVRCAVGSRRCHRRDRRRDQAVLGARLQPGRELPLGTGCQPHPHRSVGDGQAPVRSADADDRR